MKGAMPMIIIIIILALIVVAIITYGIVTRSPSKDDYFDVEKKILEQVEKEGEKTIKKQVSEEPLDIPIENALERVTKKPFGIKVSPGNSPIKPERFSGYHTGADFEVSKSEKHEPIKVRAICHGEILENKLVGGYGGTIVQKSALGNGDENIEPIIVIYGHLDTSEELQIVKPGQFVGEGDVIGFLAPPESRSSGFERKHLHLGIIKGSEIDYRGYVQDRKELDGWVNPEELLKTFQ